MKSIKNAKTIISFISLYILLLPHSFTQNYKLFGDIKDSLTGEPVLFAAVYLQNAADSVVYYTYTDENGEFALSYRGLLKGKCGVQMLGYKKMVFPIDFSEFPEGLNLEVHVPLSPEKNMLQGITIIDSTTKVIHKLDRDVHKISNEEKQTASTIYDILKTLPGVVVDESTREIRFKGSTPDILVNNMPAEYIYPDLKQINVDDIENIELIDKSSIYGGAGEGGIINIKFKKEKNSNKGFGMFLGANQAYGFLDNTYFPHMAMLNMNVKVGKAMIFNNFWIGNNKNKQNITGKGTLQLENKIFDIESIDQPCYSQTYITDILGVMFNLNKINILVADQFNYSTFYDKDYLFQTTTFDTVYHSDIQQYIYKYNYFFFNKAYIKFTLNDYKKQDVELSFALWNSLFHHPQTDEYNTESNIEQNQNYTRTTQNSTVKYLWAVNIYHADLQYRWRVSQTSQLNFHANYFLGIAPMHNKDYYTSGVEVPELQEISNFTIHYLPIGVGFIQRFRKFSIDATLNYKFQQFSGRFQRHINMVDTTLVIKMPYHAPEPSLRLKYNINSSNDLYLGYSYTTGNMETNDWNKPIQIFVPYIDKANPLYWKSGNDSLKMENYHKLYFQYRLTKDNLNFTAEVFYTATHNGIWRVQLPVSPEISLNIYENVSKQNNIGTDLSFYWKISKRWRVELNTRMYYANQTVDVKKIANMLGINATDIKQTNFEATGYFVVQYFLKTNKIGTNPSVFLWGSGESKRIKITGYDAPYFNLNLAFQTNFFKEKLFVQFRMENLLSAAIKRESHYDYAGSIMNYTILDASRNTRVALSFGLNLFKGERGTKNIQL